RDAAKHTQMLTSLWTHIPGLKVVCPSSPYDAKGLLVQAIRDNDPVIFCEHKLLYSMQGEVPKELYSVPFGEANFLRDGDDVTLVTYGRMVHLALDAAAQHSQMLTSLWTHIPGLKVVCPSSPYDAKGLLVQAIRDNDPVIFCEHKLLYSMQGEVPEELYSVP
ncbi:transketolase C-terminal domain-containing protein, partial [Pseudomonas aeruginosa]